MNTNINTFNILQFFGFNTSLTQKALQKSFWLMTMRFLLHGGTVLGFTILIACFISYYGATQLPLLFVFISIGTLIGTFLSHKLSKKISIEKLLRYVSLTIGILILASFVTIHHFTDSILFFIINVGLLFSIGVTQLNILFSMYVESSFSPLESEEAFPIIESGEPIGGLISGVIAFVMATYFSLEFLLMSWGALFFIFFIVQYIKEFLHDETQYQSECLLFNKSIYENTHQIEETEKSCIKNYCTLMQNNKLVVSLFFFALLQSAGYLLIELIYAMSASVLFDHEHSVQAHVAVASELAHGIGQFHLWTYGILLTLQITVASKIQHFFGIVKSIFIQPFLQFFATFITLISGSFFIGLLGKGIYEVIGGVSRNSYHSSFYVFSSHIREKIKEFLDGFARPVGMIFASLITMIISVLFFKLELGFIEFYIFCSALLMIVLGVNLFFYYSITEEYTNLALHNLKNEESIEEIFDAIEILSQNGHKNTIHILSKLLKKNNQSELIQIKIIEAFGELQKNASIPDLLWALHHPNKRIQQSTVKALGKFKSLKKLMINQIFSRYKIINSLQEVFLNADSKKLRLSVIKVFKNMQHPEIASFLISTLSKNNHNIDFIKEDNASKEQRDTLFCAILGCSYFHDISIAYYIQPFLKSNDSYLKSASIIALWQFNRYRKDLIKHIKEMLNSNNPDMKMSGIYTIGELKLYNFLPHIQKYFDTDHDKHIQKHCIISFIKMGFDSHIPNALNLMFHADKHIASSTKKLLSSPGIEQKTKDFIDNFIRKKVIEKIKIIIKKNKKNIYEFSTDVLEHLSALYSLIHEEKIVHTISKIIKQRKK